MKNLVVVLDGLNLGDERVSDLVCSNKYFECDIDDNLEGDNTVSVIKAGKRYGPEGEWLGVTYGTGERIILGESVLGMVLGTTKGSEVGSRQSGHGKYYDSCVRDII